jgi:hypothetical protein
MFLLSPAEATWLSRDESRQVVLNCFWQSEYGQPCLDNAAAIEAAAPA